MTCCIAVKFPNGHTKVYKRELTFPRVVFALLVLKNAIPYMQKSIVAWGGTSKVLGGWIE